MTKMTKIQKDAAEKLQKELPSIRAKNEEKVRGIFRFHELPGGTLKFPFRGFGQKIERYEFTDGEIYEVPLEIARHLNKNCWYPVHQFSLDENGKPLQSVGKRVHRCSFQSLDFMDVEDLREIGDSSASLIASGI